MIVDDPFNEKFIMGTGNSNQISTYIIIAPRMNIFMSKSVALWIEQIVQIGS